MGKLADMIIISQDLFKIPPHQTGKTKVMMTLVGGIAVYQDLHGMANSLPAQSERAAQHVKHARRFCLKPNRR